MIVSCDIFGLGDDGDDDDTMIVDPPMANVSFDYEDKILSGDTLVLTTYVRLVDSVQSIAARYAIKENTAKSILFRTREKLRRYLAGEGIIV